MADNTNRFYDQSEVNEMISNQKRKNKIKLVITTLAVLFGTISISERYNSKEKEKITSEYQSEISGLEEEITGYEQKISEYESYTSSLDEQITILKEEKERMNYQKKHYGEYNLNDLMVMKYKDPLHEEEPDIYIFELIGINTYREINNKYQILYIYNHYPLYNGEHLGFYDDYVSSDEGYPIVLYLSYEEREKYKKENDFWVSREELDKILEKIKITAKEKEANTSTNNSAKSYNLSN